ncbi:MAG: DUF559 domain-containing protein [Clostridia bacterium]|nr:DUF559 domain-containing protein [Clostridia bacterium]
MTDEEKELWYKFLKLLPMTVNRQKNIGNYIVDFFISSKNIVIEIDGRQHTTAEHKAADAKRDAELASLGLKVLRYSNRAIREDFLVVCGSILRHIGTTWDDLKKK